MNFTLCCCYCCYAAWKSTIGRLLCADLVTIHTSIMNHDVLSTLERDLVLGPRPMLVKPSWSSLLWRTRGFLLLMFPKEVARGHPTLANSKSLSQSLRMRHFLLLMFPNAVPCAYTSNLGLPSCAMGRNASLVPGTHLNTVTMLEQAGIAKGQAKHIELTSINEDIKGRRPIYWLKALPAPKGQYLQSAAVTEEVW